MRHTFIIVIAALLLPSLAGAADDPAGIEFFESKIRPLLAERCFQCHSASAKKLKGGLYLDSREGLLAGGDNGASIVPGDPEKSRLIRAVQYHDIDLQMPPKAKLPEEEIENLVKWVQMGAPWPEGPEGAKGPVAKEGFDLEKRKREHWSWQPIRRPELPPVKDAAWGERAIDRFILAKLEQQGLLPAAPADKRTLIRRVYFDLIGLPPSPDEVEAFVRDASPDAFEKVVDRLLGSEHFGERWARHWMDLVRYADTYGHEFDYPIANAEQYLYYLIRAFNNDLPYDQFVTEHIAGDLLEKPRLHPTEKFNESILATGFWFFGEQTHAPVDVRLHQADRIDNQIDVFGKTFQGLTIACARCHDHKFDAIATADYYALFGVLESTRVQQAILDRDGQISRQAAEIAKVHAETARQILAALPESEAAGTHAAAYLSAAAAVLETPGGAAAGEVVFEDFEQGSYDGWDVEGTAFGPAPQAKSTLPAYQGDVGAAGERFVNSHNARNGEDVAAGDQHTGKLTSRAFKIELPLIRMLVGGGGHEGKTCVNVIVGDRVVRSITGQNNNQMQRVEIDVTDLKGQEARIQVVDAEQGPWGNIGVDHIVFCDPTGEAAQAPGDESSVDAIAKEKRLDPAVLRRLVGLIRSGEAKKPSHPLRAWAVLGSQPTAEAFSAARDQLLAEKTSAVKKLETFPLFADFDQEEYRGWSATGHAFGDGPTEVGDYDPAQPAKRLATPGVAHSGAISNRLHGVLRSDSFIIQNHNILYRVNAKDAQIRLIIDGYTMDVFNALLFGGISVTLNTEGEYRWYQQDVSRYIGHRAHIEVIDDGDGWIALDEVRFLDGGPPPDEIPAISAIASDAASAEKLASQYGSALASAVKAVGGENAAPADVALVNWALDAEILLSPTDQERLAQIVTDAAARVEELSAAIPQPLRALAALDGNAVDPHVFIRGSHKSLGDAVPRRFLEALAGPDQAPFGAGSGRMDLARHVIDPANPLTARVMANRVWHHLLGRGIVATVDDFGVMGQAPTHPELLDHLATQFVEQGWSVKKLIRSILLSRTYQLSSSPSEASLEIDPQNNLLQHARIRRLQGEVIRDAVLAVSGRLDRIVGGPMVEVYLTQFMEGRGRPSGGPLDGAGRRSVYMRVRRNFLSPMMLAFDTPIPFNTIGRRSASNVPAQALILLNDPFIVEQAGHWARRVLAEPGLDTKLRITRMYETAFARPPTAAEMENAIAFLQTQGAEYGVSTEQAATDERLWADLAHVLMNVKEFIFLN